MNSIRLLNIDLHPYRFDELRDSLKEGVVFTPNVDHLMKLQRDQAFYQAYQQATHRVCDSRIVQWASHWVASPGVPDQIAGSDFFPAFCVARAREFRVFLLGGTTQAIADQARTNLNQQAGHPVVVDAYSPPFGFEKDEMETQQILARIHASGADVVAVGVGAPKQELWIMEHRTVLPEVKIWMAVGKTIDFVAGATARAPKWMSRFGLEWAFRLMQEPGRLARRYLLEDMPFFWLLWQQKRGRYRNPWGDK